VAQLLAEQVAVVLVLLETAHLLQVTLVAQAVLAAVAEAAAVLVVLLAAQAYFICFIRRLL